MYALSSALNQQFRPISLTNWWVNRCIQRKEERTFYNNGFLAAPFELNFAKKITTLFHESQTCIQNSGVKAGGERLVWPLASLVDSPIPVRSYSASFMTI